jgi:hypothetical protein
MGCQSGSYDGLRECEIDLCQDHVQSWVPSGFFQFGGSIVHEA